MSLTIKNKEVTFYGTDASTLVLLIEDHGEGAEVYEECSKSGGNAFTLAAIRGVDWNRDLSPWEAEPIFKKGEAFGGGAEAFLKEIEEELLPEILKVISGKPENIILSGYSLAGLFALYAGYISENFHSLVSASGSLWFPGLSDYVKSHTLKDSVKAVYISLGDKEAKSKNPLMQKVEENSREIADYLSKQGLKTEFTLNPGNHFVDDSLRLAKGIVWAMEAIKK